MSHRQLLVFAVAGALLMTFAVAVVRRTDVLDRYAPQAKPQTPEEHARAAVEAQRARLRTACGEGLSPRGTLPVRLSLAFDAEGKQTSLGVLDDEGKTPESVHVCLHRELGLNVTIPPTGEPLTVEIPYPFP